MNLQAPVDYLYSRRELKTAGSLPDGGEDGARVLGRDALLLAQCVAQVVGRQAAQLRVKLGLAVDSEQSALGRLVVDAVEAVEAEPARLGVLSLREDSGGGARRACV